MHPHVAKPHLALDPPPEVLEILLDEVLVKHLNARRGFVSLVSGVASRDSYGPSCVTMVNGSEWKGDPPRLK